MSKIHWEAVLGQLDDRYILEAASGYRHGHSDRPATQKKERFIMKTLKVRRIAALAAALTLVFLLGVTAYATGLFGILDLKAELAANPEAELISLTGYRGSKQYQAAVEWENYLLEANESGTNAFDPEQAFDEKYGSYNAFSQEARDRLDALLEKYGLKKYDRWEAVTGQTGLYAAVGVSDFLPASGGLGDLEMEPFGTVFDGKSIASFSDSATLGDGKNFPYDLFRIQSDTFLYTGFLVGNVEDFEEWTYTTEDGTAVTLCLGKIQSLLIAPLDNCFVFFNIRTGSANDDPNRSSYGRPTLTKADLEEFAEMIDFTAMDQIG